LNKLGVEVTQLVGKQTHIDLKAIPTKRERARGHKKLTGRWADNNAAFKKFALGERLGRNAFTVELATPVNVMVHFKFEIPVFQYFIHEANATPHSLGYHSLELLRNATLVYIKQNWRDYITVTG
jgi:hypothetical protein